MMGIATAGPQGVEGLGLDPGIAAANTGLHIVPDPLDQQIEAVLAFDQMRIESAVVIEPSKLPQEVVMGVFSSLVAERLQERDVEKAKQLRERSDYWLGYLPQSQWLAAVTQAYSLG